MRIICPKCQAETLLGEDRVLAMHHVPVDDEVRTFARRPGDVTRHYFDYRTLCKLSGALCKFERRI